MMSFRERKVLSAIDKATKDQVAHRISTGQYKIIKKSDPQEILLGTNSIEVYLTGYSEDIINTTIQILSDRGYVKQYTPEDTPDRVLLCCTTAKGRIALADFMKDLALSIWSNFVIPIILTAAFSAIFSRMFAK